MGNMPKINRLWRVRIAWLTDCKPRPRRSPPLRSLLARTVNFLDAWVLNVGTVLDGLHANTTVI